MKSLISQKCTKCGRTIDIRRKGALCTECRVKHIAAQAHLKNKPRDPFFRPWFVKEV